MSARRFFVHGLRLAPGATVTLPAEELRHLFTVLRAAEGDELVILDGQGTIARAVIGTARAIRIQAVETAPPPVVRVHVFAAAPRRQKMDQMLKQCAEVGAWSITPVATAHSVALPSGEAVLDRWRSELVEACKQSGNPFLPEMNELESLKTAVERAVKAGLASFYGGRDGMPLRKAAALVAGRPDVAWFVGPEGGFAPEETAMMDAAGFAALSAGRWTLRVETAAAVGTALLLDMCAPALP